MNLSKDGKTFLLTRVRLSEGQFAPMCGSFKREVKWAVTGKALREAFAKPVDPARGYGWVTLERTRQNKAIPETPAP